MLDASEYDYLTNGCAQSIVIGGKGGFKNYVEGVVYF